MTNGQENQLTLGGFAHGLKEYWFVILLIGGLIIGWTRMTDKISELEKDLIDQQSKVLAAGTNFSEFVQAFETFKQEQIKTDTETKVILTLVANQLGIALPIGE